MTKYYLVWRKCFVYPVTWLSRNHCLTQSFFGKKRKETFASVLVNDWIVRVDG